MTREEARLSVMGAISMALKDPTLQQGFEIICKNLAELEKENAELKAENDARKFAMAMSEKVEKQLREENKKAKDIIKGLLSFVDSLGNYSGGIFAKAEQFLKKDGCPDVMCEDCNKEDCGIKKLGLVGKVK